MGGCFSFFVRAVDDVTIDKKNFEMSEVEKIGKDVYSALQKGAKLVELFSPALKVLGVNVTEIEELLRVIKVFSEALELSKDILHEIEAIKIPKSLADLNDLIDINHDGKHDIDDIITYAAMTKAALIKAQTLLKDSNKDTSSIDDAINKIQTVITFLTKIKTATEEATEVPQMAAVFH